MFLTRISLFLSKAALFLGGTGDAGEGAGEELVEAPAWVTMLPTLLSLGLLVLVFYFMLIRPESKRKKAATKMRNELIVGDEITTIGGIVGKVVQIKDDTITVETGSEKTRVKVMRWAVSSKGQQITDK